MTCFIARNLLSELVDDALDSARSGELQSHVAGCESCTHELSEIKRVRQMLRALPMHKAPPDFLAKVRAKAEKKGALERLSLALSPLLRPRVAGGIAVAASLVLGVTVVMQNSQSKLWEMGAAPESGFYIGGGEQSRGDKVVLADAEKKPSDRDQGLVETAPPPAPEPMDELQTLAKKGEREQKNEEKNDALLPRATPAQVVSANRMADAAAQPTAVFSQSGRKAAGGPTQPGLYYKDANATPTPAPVAKLPSGSAGGGAGAIATKESTVRGAEVSGGVPISEPAITGSLDAPEPAVQTEAENKRREPSKKGKTVAKVAVPAEDRAGGKDFAEGDTRDRASSGMSNADDGWGSGESAAAEEMPVAATTTVDGKSQPATRTASAPAPARAVVVNARFRSSNPSAPQKIAEIAKAVGATVETTSPPSLGKVGASTNVIVEMPSGLLSTFREKLADQGTFEVLGEATAARIKLRIEVVRE